jgi:cytoskeletal protein CcmA (bactofilin family)
MVAPLLVALLLVVVGASVALAQETQLGGKLRSGDQVVVPAGETIEGDLYASGGLVRVEGRVDGDLLAAAGQVQVAGQVTGDVMAAGGSIDISGRVGGDVRAAGGQISITGSVREDLFAAGGQMTLASSGEVGEDLVFGTGQMTLDGAVAGDVLGSTGNYVRRGTVGGAENVTVTEREERAPTVADRSLAALRRLVSLLAVAVVALWLAPRLIEEPARTLRRRPLASLGIGLLGLVGFGVLLLVVILVAVLLAIGLGLAGLGDLVGTVIFALVVALAVLGFLFFLALVFGAPAGVGMSVGGLVVPSGSRGWRWVALFLGVLLVVVVSSLPVVGGWLAFLVVVFGLGALILALRPGVRRAA